MCSAVRYELASAPLDASWYPASSPQVLQSLRNAVAEAARYQPETVDFSVAALPGFHLFWSSRVGWFDPGEDLPRNDRFRKNRRGLEGTEPPA
jgi:hypothetical protein